MDQKELIALMNARDEGLPIFKQHLDGKEWEPLGDGEPVNATQYRYHIDLSGIEFYCNFYRDRGKGDYVVYAYADRDKAIKLANATGKAIGVAIKMRPCEEVGL